MDKPFYKQQYLASRIRQYKRKRNIGFFAEDYLRARPFGNIIVAFGSRCQFKRINFFYFKVSEPNSKHATEFCLNVIKSSASLGSQIKFKTLCDPPILPPHDQNS